MNLWVNKTTANSSNAAFKAKMRGLATAQSGPAHYQGMLLVLIGAVGMGLNPLFARWMYADGLTPETALLYKSLFPALCYLPFVAAARRAPAAAIKTGALGIFNGIGTIAYLYAIAKIPVATVALVYFTYPLFTIMLGWIFFNVPLTRRSVATVGLILTACLLILSPGRLSADQFQTLLISFLTPISFAILFLGFDHWLRVLPLWPRIALAMWGQTLIVGPFLLFSSNLRLVPLTTIGWVGVVGLATISSLIPQVLLTAGIQIVGAARTSVLGASELVTALAVGWLILAEPVHTREVAGAILILMAAFLSRQKI